MIIFESYFVKSVPKKNSQKSDAKLIFAEVILANGGELALYRQGIINESEIQKIKINALIENKTFTLHINKNIKSQLNLPVIGQQLVYLADKTLIQAEIVGPIEIHYKNHSTTLQALVLDGSEEVRIGTIALDAMGILIDLRQQKLAANPRIHRLRPNITK